MKLGKVFSGAGIGGVAGLALGGLPGAIVGAGLGGLSSYTTEAQNKANQKALDRSNQYDYWLWQNSNEYNSPIQQMQRLAQAGLNPNLVYGSGSVTGNTSGVANSNGVASLTAQDYSKQSLANYQSLLTAQQMEAGIANTKANTDNLFWQAGLNQNNASIANYNANIARYREAYAKKEFERFKKTGKIPESYHNSSLSGEFAGALRDGLMNLLVQ